MFKDTGIKTPTLLKEIIFHRSPKRSLKILAKFLKNARIEIWNIEKNIKTSMSLSLIKNSLGISTSYCFSENCENI